MGIKFVALLGREAFHLLQVINLIRTANTAMVYSNLNENGSEKHDISFT